MAQSVIILQYKVFMDKRNYSAEGIILSRKNYGEADRILTIFTKYSGKNRVIAKGVRKMSSRKRGSLELFSHIKFFAAYGKGLDIMTEVEEKNSFSAWRGNLQRVAVAYHLSEVVEKLTPEGQEHKEIFELVKKSYLDLKNIEYNSLPYFVSSFKIAVLEELGFIERNKKMPENLDSFIEDLINGKLKTKRFLLQAK